MPLTFADAAEEVLKRHSKGAPMHYREITELAVTNGLIEPGGQTPSASMNVAIRQDIKRQDLSSRDQRFRAHGRGVYSLTLTDDPLDGAIQRKNAEVRRQLRERLGDLHPRVFEEVIGELLTAVGYEDVEVTKYVGDGGIDVRATLTVGGVTRVQTAIQVKRWAKNVSGRTVRELRGALGPHERGLIITLSGFTRDAMADASSETRMPISLVDGDRLLDLLIDHDIGVIRRKVTVYELDEGAFSDEAETPELNETPAEPLETIARPTDGRARSLWPLPGGRRAWKGSLDRMLGFVASTGPTMAEAVAWMIQDFPPVSSGKVARGYWQVPKSFGLVETDGEHLALTTEGAAYLKDGSPELLLASATRNVLGISELLEYLRERPHTAEEILERMRSELGVSWETDLQVGFRLGWLENLGIAATDGDSWSLCRDRGSQSGRAPAAVSKPASGLDTHFPGLPSAITGLFERLEEEVLALDEAVERVFRRQYVAYRIGKHTICSVIPQKKRLRLVLPLNPREIQHHLVRDISGVGHWGIGELEVSYASAEHLGQVMTWVRQAVKDARSPSRGTPAI
jgi:predicted transport protein